MHNGRRMWMWAAAGLTGAVIRAAAADAPAVTLDRLDELASGLAEHPPGFPVAPVREQAFLDLDRFFESAVRPGQPFDLTRMPNELWQWIDRRLLRTLDEVAAAPVDAEELAVWQMYNMGLLCRSGKAIVGLDLMAVPGAAPGFHRRVAAQVDVLLVTHAHPDHCDADLVQACLDAGKPVFLPAVAASERAVHPRLHGIEENLEAEVAGVKITARRGVHVWAGSRENPPILYYEVTFPSGRTVIFCGDLDYTREFEKTPGRAVDLLVIPWRSPSARYEPGAAEQTAERRDAVQIALDRIQPRGLLYSHYAELGHVHDGLPASYAIAAGLKRAVPAPSEFLFWGEALRLPATDRP